MALHVVTGGAGYFGSILVRRLAARGERVRVFDLNAPDDAPDGTDVVLGDVCDEAAVARACEGAAFVHHNVAQVPLARDRRAFRRVNRDGTANVLRAALRAGARKFVYTSSSAVFGVPERNPVDESMQPRPAEAYGAAKLDGERLCAQYAARGLDVTIVRPRTIVGAGRLGIMQILFEWIRTGRNVPVLGRGDNRYQFVHADDLADACLAAAARPGPATYHVGAERFGTMRETLEALVAHARSPSRIVRIPLAPAAAAMRVAGALGLSPLGAYHALMYGRSMYFDVSRAKAELAWTPRYGNVELFREAYDWYVENREAVLARRGASPHRMPVQQGLLAIASRLW